MYGQAAYRFDVIWKIPCLGRLLCSYLQDSGRSGFQALGSDCSMLPMLSEPCSYWPVAAMREQWLINWL